YRGLLNVEAGIERKDIEKTEAIVLHQLKEIQDGLFTDRELYLTKELLKSELLQIADSPLSMIESDYSLSLIDQNKLSVDEWIKKIDNVNRSDVAQLARLIDLKAIFKLIGENS
ncbi:MAG: insulinase family protein, partial [Alkalibacterium sp.]